MTSQNAQIRPLPILTVVGMRVRVKPMSAQISKLWEDFLGRIDEIPYRIDPDVTVGVMGHWDQALNQFDYQAGVLVSDARTVPSGMVRWEIPAAMYAVFDATLATVSDVFEQIPEQLYDLGYQQASGPCIERYGPDFMQPEQPLQVWVPVKRSQAR